MFFCILPTNFTTYMMNSVYNTIRSINALFMFNFMLCALCFWGLHPFIIDEEKHYIFTRIMHDPYLAIVSGYLITYGIMSLFFSIFYMVFKTYTEQERNKPKQYIKIFGVLFLVGLVLDAAGWYYWGVGKEFNLTGISLIINIISTYINDLLFIYLKGILLWFASTIIITTLMVRNGFISDRRFDK